MSAWRETEECYDQLKAEDEERTVGPGAGEVRALIYNT